MSEEYTGLVHIVDDDEAVRDSIMLLLRSVGQDSVGYADANEFLENYQDSCPGCALFDIRMPGMGGLELLSEVRSRGWRLPVIIITGHGDVPMAVQAMKEGARDFLQKPFREEELLQRVRQALKEGAENSNSQQAVSELQARFESLTPRELEIARCIVDGRANKVIAIDLGISLRTVELHRARVMEKMQADSVAELVRIMLQVDTELDT